MTHNELNQICNIERAALNILQVCSDLKDRTCLGRDDQMGQSLLSITINRKRIEETVGRLNDDGGNIMEDDLVFEECKRCEKPQNECDCE
jgi:hypothetical protein